MLKFFQFCFSCLNLDCSFPWFLKINQSGTGYSNMVPVPPRYVSYTLRIIPENIESAVCILSRVICWRNNKETSNDVLVGWGCRLWFFIFKSGIAWSSHYVGGVRWLNLNWNLNLNFCFDLNLNSEISIGLCFWLVLLLLLLLLFVNLYLC